jgi:predicted RNase H-like HicB family nuclease
MKTDTTLLRFLSYLGCHTQAKTLDELIKRIREAIEAYLEAESVEPAQGVDLTSIQFVEGPK